MYFYFYKSIYISILKIWLDQNKQIPALGDYELSVTRRQISDIYPKRKASEIINGVGDGLDPNFGYAPEPAC